MRDGSSVTYFNHDHRKGENIRLLAISPPFQNLWRGPSRSVATLELDALHRIQVLSDCGEAKIRESCMAGVVQKDIYLVGYQWGCDTRFRKTTHSLKVPMD